MVPFLFVSHRLNCLLSIIIFCHEHQITMIFSLAIYAAPYSSQTSHSAYNFALAVLENGHSLYRVFFYHDAIHTASSLSTPPQDEINFTERWSALAKTHKIDLVVCISAALKRGLLNHQEATRYEKKTFNLAEDFEISGLGQLVDAAVVSDRLITFGG